MSLQHIIHVLRNMCNTVSAVCNYMYIYKRQTEQTAEETQLHTMVVQEMDTPKTYVGNELLSPNTQNKKKRSSSNVGQTQVLHDDSGASTSSQNQNNEYNVGDIVWVKMGKYPFWPSIVCYDPYSNTYIKRSSSKLFIMY